MREHLRKWIDRACIARGEAQWTNGYRAGSHSWQRNPGEDDRLYRKEIEQFKTCGKVEQQVERAIAALIRTVR